MQITLGSNHFTLLPQKAIYWEEQKWLILADAHFGKATHFRKHGIYVPAEAYEKDLQILESLFAKFSPKSLLVIGDMFHSVYNQDCVRFADFMQNYNHINTILIKGNHDILPDIIYKEINIQVIDNLIVDNLFLTHEIELDLPVLRKKTKSKSVAQDSKAKPTSTMFEFAICGHFHPSFSISNKGNQNLKLPCYFLHKNTLILPAFGSFTGSIIIHPQFEDKVYVVGGDKVYEIPNQ